ncbi:SpoVR family protein [Paenibacillus hamazuiensis]|uniref:SpoVR family protein n=1 Tax=Paenibacillus hamazuiensis TaxID=2936508 RepID=UPI00200D73EA
MFDTDYEKLEKAIETLHQMGAERGLDYFPMRYEICPAEVLYSIGAYGMPTRFAHWSFGKAYQRMKSEYDMGLSRIYELVINSDPCYAFLLDSNSLLQNKLIVAHVLGHSDFFKNNAMFAATDRDMVSRMALFADRVGEFEHRYGPDAVESFLDAGLAIQEHVDPYIRAGRARGYVEAEGGDKDVIGFIARESRVLEDWQREILYMLRAEMLYFWPQMETKILNEGWASYWHLRLMEQLELEEAEIIEFAKMNAGVVQPGQGRLNPYYLGLRMLQHIERKQGIEALFEIRETDSDASFVRNYLTQELVTDMDLFLFRRESGVYKVTATDVEQVRDQLVRSRTNGGFPYITAKDGDFHSRGELLLVHRFEGLELDRKYIERTLPLVFKLWGRPVHLETNAGGKPITYAWDGRQLSA